MWLRPHTYQQHLLERFWPHLLLTVPHQHQAQGQFLQCSLRHSRAARGPYPKRRWQWLREQLRWGQIPGQQLRLLLVFQRSHQRSFAQPDCALWASRARVRQAVDHQRLPFPHILLAAARRLGMSPALRTPALAQPPEMLAPPGQLQKMQLLSASLRKLWPLLSLRLPLQGNVEEPAHRACRRAACNGSQRSFG